MPFAFIAPPAPRVAPLFTEEDYARQRAFFTAHPELSPTPLRRFPALGRALSLADLYAKDETRRFGLNAFKAAGATFAIATLRARGELDARETLVCASEGNHGRAVARAARDAGCRARVYLAESVASSRVQAIASEHAAIVRVPGTYDAAVKVMAEDARTHGWRVISDTALDGEPTDVPRLIMLGYTRLMDEALDEWRPHGQPDAIFVPGGVGGLLAAVTDWTASQLAAPRPVVVCVEPVSAACLQVSARAGRPTMVPGPFNTVMAGLRCGEVSRAGFETVRTGVGAFVAIEDRWAIEAMRRLAAGRNGDPVVEAGASGAASLGGLLAALDDPALPELRERLGLGPDSRALVLVTEGATDPELFAGAVGRPSSEHLAAGLAEH